MFKYLILVVALIHQGYSYPFPKPTDHALTARQLVHKANWISIATLSTDAKVNGYPFVNLKSTADSTVGGESSGNLYMLLTSLDFTAKDLAVNSKTTILITNEQDLSCSKNGVDPMEPTCARTIISGQVVEVKKTDEDYEFGLEAFISRHPAAKDWVEAHHFVLHKIDIQNILVLDWYGGAHNIKPEDYYKVKMDK